MNAPITVSAEISPSVADQWRLAIVEAELDEAMAHLLAVPGCADPDAPKAASYPADKRLQEESGDLVRGPALAEANSDAVIGKQRIAIYTDFDEADPVELAIVGAKLRHELRHAEQRLSPVAAELFSLAEFADEIASRRVGGLPGGALIYNLMPIELDANAAAADFLAAHHPAAVTDILDGEDAALARSNTPPEAIIDLPAKTVAFMFVFREIAEDPNVFPNMPFERRLGHISDTAAATWRALVGEPTGDAP